MKIFRTAFESIQRSIVANNTNNEMEFYHALPSPVPPSLLLRTFTPRAPYLISIGRIYFRTRFLVHSRISTLENNYENSEQFRPEKMV